MGVTILPVYTLLHHAVHKAMKLVLCQIQMEPEEQKSQIEMRFPKNTVTPVFHGLYRARVVVEAGKLRACSDDIHEVCELVLVLPGSYQTCPVYVNNNKS